MKFYNSIEQAIGNTPLVKINNITRDLKFLVLAKPEFLNPGNSVKDRIGYKLIEDAIKRGLLKKGGTIIEATSGNTGVGIAINAIQKGYRCIFTISDRQSPTKVNILRALGAEVIVCPVNVDSQDPRSYCNVALDLSKKIPNSVFLNQYDNLSNQLAHFQTTGPEIWNDTLGKVTCFCSTVGTGGTISGVAKFLKSKRSDIKILGVDAYGSILRKYHETGCLDPKELHPYLTEGIGDDVIPGNIDFSLIDHLVKVTDKQGALMARRLAREEGLLAGWSSGSALEGALEWGKKHLGSDDVMVVSFPDHADRYLDKIYSDSWMQEQGFLDNFSYPTLRDVLSKRSSSSPTPVSVSADTPVATAVRRMMAAQTDYVGIKKGETLLGSLSTERITQKLMENPNLRAEKVEKIMSAPLPVVSEQTTLDAALALMAGGNEILPVREKGGETHLIGGKEIRAALLREMQQVGPSE